MLLLVVKSNDNQTSEERRQKPQKAAQVKFSSSEMIHDTNLIATNTLV